MSPLALHNFRSTQTTLDLNGPSISVSSNPSNVVAQAVGVTSTVGVTVGVATFTGGGSATLGTPNAPGATQSTGNFIYQWYDNDGKLTDGTNVTGAGTSTLTLSNLASPGDDNRSFYLEIDYSSGTYSTTTYRGLGKSINGPLNTNSASLNVLPTVTITTEPTAVTIGQGEVATFTAAATTSDASIGSLTYYWEVDGVVVVDEGRADAITGPYAEGATTTTLKIKKTDVGTSFVQFFAYVDDQGYRVQAKSKGCNLVGVLPRRMLKFEAYSPSDNTMKNLEKNIGEDGAFTLETDTFTSSYGIVQFYSPEENYNLRMTMGASKGADTTSYTGGGGGKSIIDFRLLKNIEYTVIGVCNNSALFLYRGAQLMAVVGQGGDAGTGADGGAGGGVNMAGGNGDGKNAGRGGAKISPGNFNLTGQWGSILSDSSFTLRDDDIVAEVPNGGRTISCSKGAYWINQGIGACENNSSSAVQYRSIDGTLMTNSASITRGFKPGYTVTECSGKAISDGGNGGNGGTGGEGGVQGSGGGGGSGYSDDSFEIRESELGGNTTATSTVKFEIAV